jgi:hypothetical protein
MLRDLFDDFGLDCIPKEKLNAVKDIFIWVVAHLIAEQLFFILPHRNVHWKGNRCYQSTIRNHASGWAVANFHN